MSLSRRKLIRAAATALLCDSGPRSYPNTWPRLGRMECCAGAMWPVIWRQSNAKMMRDPTTVRSNIRLARPQEDRTWLIGVRNIAMLP